MALPYDWTVAVLCVFQGLIVAAGWRRRWHIGASRLVGLALPVVVLAIGVTATRQSGWSTDAIAALATFGAPLAAVACAAALGWQPSTSLLVVPLLFVVAWRLDGLIADAAGVLIIGGACLAIAALIAATSTQRAIALGLVDESEPEPLPADSPLWKLPNVIITPHVSAESDVDEQVRFAILRENLRRYVAGEKMLSVVDVAKGY